MNDFELISGLKKQDSAALEAAIERYSGYVMAVLSKTLGVAGTQEDKEELLTDVFVTLWEYREKLQEKGNLKYWLAVVARNAALQYLRGLHLTEPLEEDWLETGEDDTPVFMERMEQARQVRLAVNALSAEDRDLFIRHYFWRQSVSRIAKETGINQNTIKSRLKRGREKLRAILIREGCVL